MEIHILANQREPNSHAFQLLLGIQVGLTQINKIEEWFLTIQKLKACFHLDHSLNEL